MNLTDLFEEDDEIGIKDPKAKQALNVARSKYGWATNDLEAFVAMMQDEQVNQDKDIESQFDVNTDQEKEIGTNDQDIDSLEQRISQLEQGSVKENARQFTESDNFTADDLQSLGGIRDLETLKARAKALISTNSKRPMKPEKVQWFNRAIDSKNNPQAIIKLMWDLLLSGEGTGVIGSQFSTKKNTYRQKFDEDANVAIATNQQTANTKLDKKIKATYKMLMHKINMTLDKEGVAELEVYLNKLKRLAISKGIELTEEDIEWEPQPEFRGVGGTATSYGDSAKRQRQMGAAPDSNRRYNRTTQKPIRNR